MTKAGASTGLKRIRFEKNKLDRKRREYEKIQRMKKFAAISTTSVSSSGNAAGGVVPRGRHASSFLKGAISSYGGDAGAAASGSAAAAKKKKKMKKKMNAMSASAADSGAAGEGEQRCSLVDIRVFLQSASVAELRSLLGEGEGDGEGEEEEEECDDETVVRQRRRELMNAFKTTAGKKALFVKKSGRPSHKLRAFLKDRWVPITNDQMRMTAFDWRDDRGGVSLNFMDREVLIRRRSAAAAAEEEVRIETVTVRSIEASSESETGLVISTSDDEYRLHLQMQRNFEGRERVFGRCVRCSAAAGEGEGEVISIDAVVQNEDGMNN